MAIGIRSALVPILQRMLGGSLNSNLEPSQETIDDAINNAIDQYGKYRPNYKIKDTAGDGASKRFALATLITGWVPGTYQIASVGTVDGVGTANEEEEVPIAFESWSVYKNSSGAEILLIAAPISTSATMRVRYTVPHVVHTTDPLQSTIPEIDTESFKMLAVAYLCDWISRKASDITNASLNVDLTFDKDVPEAWSKRAVELVKLAVERLSGAGASPPSSGAAIDWPRRSSAFGWTPIGH